MHFPKISAHFGMWLTCCLLICGTCGCSSVGLGVWPAQFRLLTKTKEIAASSPLPSGMPHELSKFELPDYFLEPGDRVLIEPVDLESEVASLGDQKIQIDGTVDLGKFGRIRVAGMTVEEMEHAVENQIASYRERESINVQLVETNAAEVFVIGEVGSPAAYPIDGHEHVLDVILRAGGLTSKASPCDIILVRPTNPCACRVVLPVCYRQITQLGDVTTNYQLQPGDRIVVGSRSFWEELSFRKQKQSCDRCDRSCGAECQPVNVQYQNRCAQRIPSFLIPSRQPSANGTEADGSGKQNENTTEPNSYFREQAPSDREQGKSDDDLFLPSLNTDGSPKPDNSELKNPDRLK